MAHFRRKRSKRSVRCTMCTQHRWKGNHRDRLKVKDRPTKIDAAACPAS